jgi:hypothetical protein
MIRYAIAIIFTCVAVAAGLGIGRHLRTSFIQGLRDELRTAKADGKLPSEWKDVDIDNFAFEELDLKVTEGQERQLWLADWLSCGWRIWGPVILIASVGVAYLMGPRR